MGEIHETYYVAGRIKDIPPGVLLPPDSIFRLCLQCNDKVMIHPDFAQTADEAKGIVCSPCVQEITNMSVEELFTKNSGNMMKILTEMLNRASQ